MRDMPSNMLPEVYPVNQCYLTTSVPFYSNTDTDNATPQDFTKGGTSLTFRGPL